MSRVYGSFCGAENEPPASLNRRSENIWAMPVIISELELGNIERKVLFVDLVECADAARLDQRPEPFDGLSVDGANNILLFGVVNDRIRVWFNKRTAARYRGLERRRK